jgi:hypothetical protein
MKNVSKKVLDLDEALELVAKNLKPLALKDDVSSTGRNCTSISCDASNTNSANCFDSEE